ncbi:MAG: N-acetylmuramoyl-L-alanine amidase [Flavobacteriaceae bacterium]|nr:N-acetylmuramoyl-L-alanine amidase [Flavobacteriaceae bacterium]
MKVIKSLLNLFKSKKSTNSNGTKTILTPEKPILVESNKTLQQPKLFILDSNPGRNQTAPKHIDGKLLNEKKYNNKIIKAICKKLAAFEDIYFIHVDAETVKERVEMINDVVANHPDHQCVLISIGLNAYGFNNEEWRSPNGFEVWCKNNSSKSLYMAELFIRNMDDNISSDIKQRKNPIRSRSENKEFYLFRNTSIPAIQVKNGFFTNEKECEILLKNSVKNKIVIAHVKSIIDVNNS